MSEQPTRLERIDWVATFPFVRLFSAPGRALKTAPMLFCLAAVIGIYVVGRCLDGIWTVSGGGVLVAPAGLGGAPGLSELDVYATLNTTDFRTWRADAAAAASQPDSGISRRGPFIMIAKYEAGAFAGLLDAAINLRFAPARAGGSPTVVGSIGHAVYGGAWLLTQHSLFALIFVPLATLILSFCGGAACRSIAIRAARDEDAPIAGLVTFAREKWLALFCVPLLPIGVFLIAWFLLALGSVVWVIPFVGKLLTSLGFILTFIGGIALLGACVAAVLGTHLMIPTVAVEASDAFDGVQRGFGYLWTRPWHFGFYGLLMIVQSAIAFIVFRLAALLFLKLTHMGVSTGASLFGLWTGADSPASRFDAIWKMPEWAEMPWLPGGSGLPFWGDFASGTLSGFESFCMFFIALWVFFVVAKVAASALALYFSAATHVYLVLRNDIDGVDFDEIYYEETDDLFGLDGLNQKPAEESKGTPLPVVGQKPAEGK